MHGSISLTELDYLSELIDDFPCDIKPHPEAAFKLLVSRYRELENNIPNFIKLIEDKETFEKFVTEWEKLFNDFHGLPLFFYIFTIFIHGYLFDKILSNAGIFRKSTDPKGGRIGFGGSHNRMMGNFKYSGSSCSNIKDDLKNCFSLLISDPVDSVATSIEFYRRFVKIHPFYDANGRIGRLIISIYNIYNNQYILWREIDTPSNKNKFIKLLNRCHDREGQEVYNKYLKYLIDYFKQHTIPLSEINH